MRNFTGETFASIGPLVLDVELRSARVPSHFGQLFLTLPAGRNGLRLQRGPNRLHLRIANTLEGAVAPYNRLRQRYPDAIEEDYLFLSHYENRATAARVIARQFHALL